jgi:hypothetical protein
MKYLNIILVTLFIYTSCCGKKKVVDNSTKEMAQVNSALANKDFQTTFETANNEVEQTIIKHDSAINDKHGLFVQNHSKWNDLLQTHVSNQGNVDYNSFKKDAPLLRNYISSLSETIPNNKWSKQETLAYWINAYNALTIDLILRNYPIKSIKDINNPWKQRLWKLGDHMYDLDEIEHQILRKMNEPRIHFAIVCASYSCPKLQNIAFTAKNLEQQLTLATQQFLSDANRNEISENSLKLSKIFKWFSKDFEQNGSLIDFLNKYNAITISAKAKISYKDYNWDLND